MKPTRPVRTDCDLVAVVSDWINRPSWSDLLDVFRCRPPTPDDVAVALANPATALSPEWLDFEAVDPAVFAGLAAAPDSDREVFARLMLLEQFSDFCLNVRRGWPTAAAALLHAELQARGHRRFLGRPLGHRPLLTTAAWDDAAERRMLLNQYIGGGAVAAVSAVEPDDVVGLFSALEVVGKAVLGSAYTTERLGRVVQQIHSDAVAYPQVLSWGYRERWQSASLAYTPDVRDRLLVSATELGTVTSSPPQSSHHDFALVLGGGGASPLDRAGHLAALFDAGATDAGEVWMLGSPRVIDTSDELAAVSKFYPRRPDGTSPATEFDLMCAAAELRLDATGPVDELTCGCSSIDDHCAIWEARVRERGGTTHEASEHTPLTYRHERLRTYHSSGPGGVVRVLSAATSRPGLRPNTADTYGLFSRLARPGPRSTGLAITTQLFVPFQRFDALRMLALPTGASVEVVGTDKDRRTSGWPGATVEEYLQETLSGLRSARRLMTAILRSYAR